MKVLCDSWHNESKIKQKIKVLSNITKNKGLDMSIVRDYKKAYVNAYNHNDYSNMFKYSNLLFNLGWFIAINPANDLITMSKVK